MENPNNHTEEIQLGPYREKLLTCGGCLLAILWIVAAFYGFYALIRDLFL